MSVLLLLLGVFAITARGQPTADKITNLPGLTWETNYTQYSGYLDLASNGHHLHYWLTESMSATPASDPVVLWLNGGPGCSSLDGLVYEQGPFHVDDSGVLWENNYAWNLNANVIFLESPVCVGFSYSDDGQCHMTDDTTANENYLALLQFFIKFPNYVKNDFFVTGESYGGVYVPTLVRRILQGNANNEGTKMNLKGFAVGNGILSDADNDNSAVWLAYYHGLVSESLWDSLMANCCSGLHNRHSCNFASTRSSTCRSDVNSVMNVIYGGQLNWYNIYGDCLHTKREEKYDGDKLIRTLEHVHKWFHESNDYKYIKKMKADRLGGSVPCIDSTGANIWLNSASVRAATHIPSSLKATWAICSNTLHYTTQYSTLDGVFKDIYSMDPNIWTTIYNGDTDLSCNFLGDQWFTEDLGYNATDSWHEWFTNGDAGQQVGGWTINYPRARFVTVRGSGHMVPQYRPKEALKMYQYFLLNKAL